MYADSVQTRLGFAHPRNRANARVLSASRRFSSDFDPGRQPPVDGRWGNCQPGMDTDRGVILAKLRNSSGTVAGTTSAGAHACFDEP